MRFQYLDPDTPLAFAHRGGDVAAPENTLAAFRHAVDLGYRYLETDVHRTKDGVLVAFHDSGLDRVGGYSGTIADHTWDELRELDLGDGNYIPTLDELLETFPESRFNIDPKADDAVALLGDAIEAHGALNRVCVGSFSDDRIARLLERHGPTLCTSPGPRGVAKLMLGLYGVRPWRHTPHGCIQIPPKWKALSLSSSMIERIHAAGLQVHVWTINDPIEMHRLYDLGVDAIMTDKVDVLRDVLKERGEWTGAAGANHG